ncbi:MAG: hypothetical protein HUK03_05320 [Bacteroidaceae bacterium]|nr:hypothetical protein [Bacteroidaceae bacterium]
MNTPMNTTIDNEETILDYAQPKPSAENNKGHQSQQPQQQPGSKKESKNDNSQMWKNVVVGGMAAAVVGGAATMAAHAATPGTEDLQDTSGGEMPSPEDIPVSNETNDDMSFSEAFAAARDDVGPGGVFTWHGNTYGTYYKDEWEALTPEQRHEFSNQFGPAASDDTPEPVPVEPVPDPEPIAIPLPGEGGGDDIPGGGDDIPGGGDDIPGDGGGDEGPLTVDFPDEVQTVEVLGVVHDPDIDANVAYVETSEPEIVLVDTDNDNTFDIAMADFNGDNEITPDEIIDISDDGIAVEDLGGFTDPNADLFADNMDDMMNDTMDPYDTGLDYASL